MYKTYQEAKIDCPEACICREKVSGMFFAMPSKEGAILGDTSEFAEAKDHCMTVEEFLKAGYRLDVGDSFINCFGQVVEVKGENVDTVNVPHEYDNRRHVLRADSLEKPKRTEVEYEKCNSEHAWQAVKEHEENKNIFHRNESGEYPICGYDMHIIGECVIDGELYRRIETEIDERQEFIDAAIGYSYFTGSTETELILLENMYDSGKFKLVN
ncbi:hypothetical protein [Shewanella chilikensis]|uniref:hypothetical protein n=1 Tax=Shewanella chilikensis TaxID=558541 RepID=UPI003A98708B